MPKATPLRERFWSKADCQGAGCWIWTACKDGDGYGNIGFGRSTVKAHRVAWELTHGPIPPRMHVLHHCDNPPCVNPEHLFLGTQVENQRDCEAKGRGWSRHRIGELNGRAKLKLADVARIRALAQSGMSQAAIARLYPHMGYSTIKDIVRGKRWNRVAT